MSGFGGSDAGYCISWVKYTDMKRIPVADMTWQFPGSGKEYPLLPGAETTIATNAVDHTEANISMPIQLIYLKLTGDSGM